MTNQQQNWNAKVEQLLNSMKESVEQIKRDGTLGSSLSVTDEEKKQAYTLGFQFFQQNKFDRALLIFESLYALDPLNASFAKAVASCYKKMGQAQVAAIGFLMAYFYHPELLELAFLAGQTLVECGGVAQAYHIMKGILHAKRFPDNEENRKWVAAIGNLQDLVKKQALQKPGS